MIDKLNQDALIIWATIDPVGTTALFAALSVELVMNALGIGWRIQPAS